MEQSADRDAHPEDPGVVAGIGRVEAALDRARAGVSGREDAAGFLTALALLREMRGQLAGWEPELIDAARASGASWAQLAPVLGVASRQAAERRALRLRPGADEGAGAVTGEARVAAERGRRAGARAVDDWSSEHSADLRVLAAQIGAAAGLPVAARAPLAALHAALGGPDAAALLTPLLEARVHLGPGHETLAARIDALTDTVATVRADAAARRRH